MFWIYCAAVLLPAVGFYRYMNRDPGDETSIILPFVVFVVQFFLVLVGGWIALTLAGLVFAFGAFLLYGAWYMPALEKKVVIPTGETIVFSYQDRALRQSRRRIRVSDCDNTYINGFCLARKADRTFKRSRFVGDIVIESTGEVIDPNAPAHPELHKK